MDNEWLWLWTPISASILLALMLVPLGNRVLQRGVVFADIAIAQWAALGVLLGSQFDWTRQLGALLPTISLIGFSFALLASALVHLILRHVATQREAMIGTLYVVGASLATLSIHHDPHGAQALARTLNGDLLWSRPAHLATLLPVALLVLLWTRLRPARQEALFLPLFALAVTVAVDVAGIYVVFATLITTPVLLCQIHQISLPAAVVTCIAGHVLGLCFAAWQDLPVGPSVVLGTLASGTLATLLRSQVATSNPTQHTI